MLRSAQADFGLLAAEAWDFVLQRCPLEGDTSFREAACGLAELQEVTRVLRREEREPDGRLVDEGLARLPHEALDRADRCLEEQGMTWSPVAAPKKWSAVHALRIGGLLPRGARALPGVRR